MSLNMKAIGKPIGPFRKTYTWKDAVLYALGVGAGFSELNYCFEKELRIIPSFSIAMIFDFLSRATLTSGVNLAGILHGEQELIFHSPIPPEGTMTTTGKIVDYYDKGADKGALVVIESETVHDSGKRLFTSVATIFSRLDGGFGGGNRQAPAVTLPDRAPDAEIDARPSPDQPLLYRLSGDIFHLHVDPEFARMAGFEMPIMHGLCTHGFACRALIAALVPGEPERVRRLACRFSRPLYPGVPIRTQIWKTGDGKALWRTVDADSGAVIIDKGEFEYGDPPSDAIRFDDRVAIVTGAGAGLGRVYALELARRGARVVVNDLGGARDGVGGGSSQPADQVVAEILAAGGQAVASYDSVATAEGGQAIVDTALDAFGSVDIVINNAGILRDKSFTKMTPESWQAVIDVHLTGAYNVTRPAFGVMKAKGYGRIVMTTSAAGLYGNFGQANYAAAKMGLVGLMNTLKLEGAKYDIRVNTVAPLAASRLTEDIMPPDMFAGMKPELVAPLVLYLCSDRCADTGGIYNTGMGYVNRAAVMTGPTCLAGNPEHPPTPEWFHANHDRFNALDGAKPLTDLTAATIDLVSESPTQMAPPVESAAVSESVAAIFEKMPGQFIKAAAGGVDAIFQYCITGPEGGEWAVRIKDEACTVTPGRIDGATCILTIADQDFIRLNVGELPAMEAFTTGKLVIEGNLMQAQLLEQLFSRG